MSRQKTTLLSATLIALIFFVIGMVISSKLDMAQISSAQTKQVATSSINSDPLDEPLDAGTFRRIASEQTSTVVNIRTESKQTPDVGNFGGDLFRRFFGQPAPQERPREETVRASGTGFIIDPSGLILTNNHVVEDAIKIEIDFFGDEDGLYYQAQVLGRDPLTDSALLELIEYPDQEIPVAKFGDSSQMQAGDWVMAIGNPFGLGHTVTVGIISATGRPFRPVPGRWQDVLQTDAAINPGNSGGPLLNIRGEVVGINTAIISDRSSNVGIGFAIPSNTVRDLLPQLRSGKVTRGRIGVQIMDVGRESYQDLGLSEAMGAIVSSVQEDGPAAIADVQPGDVIIHYNGEQIENTQDLQNKVVATAPGTTVPMIILRGGEELTLNVTIEELDLEEETSSVVASNEDLSEGFGMTLQDLTPSIASQLGLPVETTGAVVSDVARGSTAESGGVRPGDVILSINRVDVTNATEAVNELNGVESERTAFLLIQRGQNRVFLQVRKE